MKLIKLSTKSWHYKLIQWFLGDKSPTPSNTFNFCRYFWILVFVMVIMVPIVGPFKLIIKLFTWIGDSILNFMEVQLTKSMDKWSESLDKYTAYNIYNYDSYGRVPKKFNKILLGDRDKVLSLWAKKEFGLDWFNDLDRIKIRQELDKIYDERSEVLKNKRKIEAEQLRLQELREVKRIALIANINNKLSFIGNGYDWLISRIKPLFSYDYTEMIKVAKKVVGVLLTAVFLVVSFVVVNILVMCLLTLGIAISNNWHIILQVLGWLVALVGTLAILYFIVLFVYNKIEDLIEVYKRGDSVWYIQVLYVGIVRPLYYIVYLPVYWVVMIPLNFIFNHLLWEFVCLRLFKPFGIWFWKGLISFTGIFGEYFSASKGDYCPGVSWDDENI